MCAVVVAHMVLEKLIGIDHPPLNNVDQVSSLLQLVVSPIGEVNFKIIASGQIHYTGVGQQEAGPFSTNCSQTF